jgi:biopolymer transport protein ExbB
MRSSFFFAAALAATLALPAAAQQTGAATLDQLLEQTRAARANEARENEARVQRFQSDLARQQQLLNEARAERDAQARRADQQSAAFDENERKLSELQAQLDAKAGNLGEMFGVVRQVAGDVSSVALNSLVTVQYPERKAPLAALAGSKALPSIEELETLWFEMLREINESGKVARFSAGVVSPDGSESQQEVVRVGSFNVVSGNRFLSYLTGETKLTELAAQPEGRYRSYADDVFDARSGYVGTAIDPTRGALLAVLVQRPSLNEQIQAGGLVGYVIIALGLFGLLIAIERFVALSAVGAKIGAQRKQLEQPQDNNPLGRVLGVYHQDPTIDHETLELRLDEAVLREVPALEVRLPWLKILAAIAPLLGLLGTVTGMILTFQQITLFGTGDPKLMAGGISQALVTTVLGLVVAIPMVILHSWLSGKSKGMIQVLEEESAGLIAENAEKRHA